MAAPEQQQRETPPRRAGLITSLIDIETDTERIKGNLRKARIGLMDETGSPKASEILEGAISNAAEAGMLRTESLMIKTLTMAGVPSDRINALFGAYRQLKKIEYGDILPPKED